jgi:hypothetical protein
MAFEADGEAFAGYAARYREKSLDLTLLYYHMVAYSRRLVRWQTGALKRLRGEGRVNRTLDMLGVGGDPLEAEVDSRYGRV